MSKTFLFQAIHFSTSTQFNSIWLIARTRPGSNIPGQSEPGRDGNEEVLHIPLSSNISVPSPSDCLVSYSRHS